MRIDYRSGAIKDIEDAPANVRKAFYKQVKLLAENLRHPSLHAKKYSESTGLWQARVNADWRFYFVIEKDSYVVLSIKRHPK